MQHPIPSISSKIIIQIAVDSSVKTLSDCLARKRRPIPRIKHGGNPSLIVGNSCSTGILQPHSSHLHVLHTCTARSASLNKTFQI